MNQPPPAAPRALLFTLRIAVRWSDMDANGHVNNAKCFTYFEQARIEWLEREGLQTTAENQGPVVVKTACTYLRPIPHPVTLEVRLHAGAPGRSSFPTFYEVFSVGEGVKYLEGEATMVWTDRTSGRSCPVPDRLRAMLPAPA